jgi:hypothetical protein
MKMSLIFLGIAYNLVMKNLLVKQNLKQLLKLSIGGCRNIAPNVFGLYARWRFKAQTVKQELMMIEAQMFNLPLHRHWRKTRVTGWCGLIAQKFNYARK